jgi:coenzyme PQQ biosynthesis protein PqqD
MASGPEVMLGGRLRRQDGILAQQAHGQTVLLRLEDGGYYALDEVGATIWELCDGSRSVGDIVTLLCAEFDAPESTVRADVLEFIADLRRERLLVVDAAQ